MELPVQNIRGNRADDPLAGINRQPASARPGFHGILPHQPFNAVKATREAFSQDIMPDTSCAIGPVAAKKA